MLKKYLDKKILLSLLIYLFLSFFIYFFTLPNVFALENFNINDNNYVYFRGISLKKSTYSEGGSRFYYRTFSSGNFYTNDFLNDEDNDYKLLSEFLDHKFYYNETDTNIAPAFLRLEMYVNTKQNIEELETFDDNIYIHTLFYSLFDFDIEKDEYANLYDYVSNEMQKGNSRFRELKQTYVKIDNKTYVLVIFSHTFYPGELDLYNGVNDGYNMSYFGYTYYFDFTSFSGFGERKIPVSNSYISINNVKFSHEDDYYTTNDLVLDSLNMEQSNQNEFLLDNIDNSKRDNFFITFLKTIKEDFENSIESFWNKTKESLKSMFVPTESYISLFIARAKDQIETQFGVFVYPIKLFIDILNRFLNLSSTNFVINVPDINVPLFDYPIIKATSYDLSEVLNKGSIHNLWILYLDFIDVYMIIAFLNLTWNKFNSFMGGMISENEYLTVEDSETYDNVTGEFKGSRRRISKSKRQRRKVI